MLYNPLIPIIDKMVTKYFNLQSHGGANLYEIALWSRYNTFNWSNIRADVYNNFK